MQKFIVHIMLIVVIIALILGVVHVRRLEDRIAQLEANTIPLSEQVTSSANEGIEKLDKRVKTLEDKPDVINVDDPELKEDFKELSRDVHLLMLLVTDRDQYQKVYGYISDYDLEKKTVSITVDDLQIKASYDDTIAAYIVAQEGHILSPFSVFVDKMVTDQSIDPASREVDTFYVKDGLIIYYMQGKH